MANREFIYWCRDAISGIRYWKDRNRVFTELYQHLEDRYDSFIARGMTHEEAEKKTLEAMGDPNELAPQLAAIHKPHWAYAAIATRFIALVLFFLCLGRSIPYFLDLEFYQKGDNDWDPFTNGGEQRIAYVQPDASFRASGYTFCVEEAALWRTFYSEPTEEGEYFDMLYVRLKVSNPVPWMGEQRAVYWMWAVDSNGRYYQNQVRNVDGAPWISCSPRRTGIGFYEYELGFQGASRDIQWIELHYDRDGRDMVLRIDLRGGEGQ